jgi:hypothetical protein
VSPAFELQNYYTFLHVKHLGISSLQYSSDRSITPQELKKKKFGSCWHHYLKPIPLDFSLCPYCSHTNHFSTNFFLWTRPPSNTLIWALPHWIQLIALIVVIHFTHNPFSVWSHPPLFVFPRHHGPYP